MKCVGISIRITCKEFPGIMILYSKRNLALHFKVPLLYLDWCQKLFSNIDIFEDSLNFFDSSNIYNLKHGIFETILMHFLLDEIFRTVKPLLWNNWFWNRFCCWPNILWHKLFALIVVCGGLWIFHPRYLGRWLRKFFATDQLVFQNRGFPVSQ